MRTSAGPARGESCRAARKVFAQHGYRGATIGEIADEAALSNAGAARGSDSRPPGSAGATAPAGGGARIPRAHWIARCQPDAVPGSTRPDLPGGIYGALGSAG